MKKKVLLLGSGELGKEVVIALQRLGQHVVAVDSYAGAPAMQVADRSHVVSMLDGAALRAIIEQEKPDLVIPEVEAIAKAKAEQRQRQEEAKIFFEVSPSSSEILFGSQVQGVAASKARGVPFDFKIGKKEGAMVVGGAFYAYLVGTLTAIVTSVDAATRALLAGLRSAQEEPGGWNAVLLPCAEAAVLLEAQPSLLPMLSSHGVLPGRSHQYLIDVLHRA